MRLKLEVVMPDEEFLAAADILELVLKSVNQFPGEVRTRKCVKMLGNIGLGEYDLKMSTGMPFPKRGFSQP